MPFGKVGEVLPYLIRRAQENSTVLSGVGKVNVFAFVQHALFSAWFVFGPLVTNGTAATAQEKALVAAELGRRSRRGVGLRA